MGISYDEYRANGYKEVWGIGDKDLIRRFCNAERLLLTKVDLRQFNTIANKLKYGKMNAKHRYKKVC